MGKQSLFGRAAEQHEAILIAFAKDNDGAVLPVDLLNADPLQFRNSARGCKGQFDQGELNRRASRGNQLLDLLVSEEVADAIRNLRDGDSPQSARAGQLG